MPARAGGGLDAEREATATTRSTAGHTGAPRWLAPTPCRERPRGGELVLLAAVVGGFAAAALAVATTAAPFGHDEAVYAVQARAWLTDAPASGVGPHRAPLLPLLGLAVVPFTTDESAFRLWGVVFGVVAVTGVWALARLLGGPVAGLVAAGVFGFAASVLDAAGEYLTDLPAAGLLVWAAVVAWWQLERAPGPGRGLLLLAPLAAGALYLRYGSALVIALLGVTALALWWRVLREHLRLAAATVGLLALLLVPHLVRAIAEFGVPWGRITYTSEVAGRAFLGEGLADYVRWLPGELAGRMAAVLLVTGLLAGAAHLARAGGRRLTGTPATPAQATATRRWALLVVPALAHVVAIGLAAHGDPRFVFFAIALLCGAGALAVAEALAWLSRVVGSRGVAAALAAIAVLLVANAATVATDRVDVRARSADNVGVVVAAAADVRDRSWPDCGVVTGFVPQMAWYSGCEAVPFREADELDAATRYVLFVEDGKGQPSGAELDRWRELAGDPVAALRARGNVLGDATLHELDADATTAATTTWPTASADMPGRRR